MVKQKLRELAIISRGADTLSTTIIKDNGIYRFYSCSKKRIFSNQFSQKEKAIVVATAWDFPSQGENFLVEYTNSPFNASTDICVIRAKKSSKKIISIFCSLKSNRQLLKNYFCSTRKIKRLNNEILLNFLITNFPLKSEKVLEKLLDFSCSTSFFAQRINLLSQYFSEQLEIKTNQLLHSSSI